jgi:hypothetical protein
MKNLKFNKYNVIFVISGNSHGLGGHHYSVRDLAQTSECHYNSKVIQVGSKANPCFLELGSRFKFIKTTLHKPWSVINAINECKHFSDEKNTCFIAFDYYSLSIIRLAFRNKKQSIIFCKPGGPNWKFSLKQIPTVLLFSEENFDYYLQNQPEVANNSYLIKGRVKELNPTNLTDIDFFNNFLAKKKIFCVARFAPEKKVIFDRAIRFYEEYFKFSNNSHLFIIGLPSHSEVVNAVRERIKKSPLNKSISLCITPEYYQAASRIFGIADFLIGNGRTVIESMSLGIPSFVATESRELPILVTKESLCQLSPYNLSSRSIISDEVYENSLNYSKSAINDELFSTRLKLNTKKLFDLNYNINTSHGIIKNAIYNSFSKSKIITLEINDYRMLLVGLMQVNYPQVINFIKYIFNKLRY